MNHFRVLLSAFLLSPLFHMLKGWAGCSGTHPLPQCSLVSISNRCCKLELHSAGWMRLQDLLVTHALGFSSNALGYISDALSSPSQSSLCTRQRSGRSGSFPGASSVRKRSWYLVGLLHAADHHLLPHLWCVAILLTLTWVSLGEMHWKQIFPKIIMLFLVDSFQAGASQSGRAGRGAVCQSWLFFLLLFYNKVTSFMSVVLLPLGGMRWKWNLHSLTRYEQAAMQLLGD